MSDGTDQNRLAELRARRQASSWWDAASAYYTHFTEGPITPDELAAHRHVLRETENVLQALDNLDRVLSGDTSRAYEGLADPLRRFMRRIQVPMGFVVEPTQKPIKIIRKKGIER